MSIAYVNSTFVHGTGTSTTVTKTYVPRQVGNLLIASWEDNPGALDAPTIADTNTNTWAVGCPVTPLSSGVNGAIWYCASCKAGTTDITVTGDSCSSRRLFIAEFSGCDPFSPCDQHSEATGLSGTPDSGAKTTLFADELIFGWLVGSSAEVKGATFNLDQDDPGSGCMTEYKIVYSVGSYSATFTQTSDIWLALMVTFKARPFEKNYRTGIFSKDAVLSCGAFDMGVPNALFGWYDDDFVAQFSGTVYNPNASQQASVPWGVFSKDATLDGAFDD